MEDYGFVDTFEESSKRFERIKLRESFTSKLPVPLLLLIIFTMYLLSIMIF